MKNLKHSKKKGILVFLTIALLFQAWLSVSTFAASDSQAPTIPSGLTTTNIAYTTVSLQWNPASDNIQVKGYLVYRDGKEMTTTVKTSYTNKSLIPGNKYVYFIKAFDAAGNVSGSSALITVTTTADTGIPTKPSSLVAFSKSYSTVSLTWNPSTDNIKVKNYIIFCNGKKVATSTNYYYVCKGLTPGKAYAFSVLAVDISGNCSALSNIVSTATLPDNSSPSTPTSFSATSIRMTEINLTWSPSMDNVKVKGYEISCAELKTASTSKTTYTFKNLLPGKRYTFYLKAIDAMGNLSAAGNMLTIATPPDLEPPTEPSNLKAASLNGSTILLSWDASQDNIKVKGYQIFCNGFKIADTTGTNYSVKSPVGLGLDKFCIRAYDLVDNLSAPSNIISPTT